jgi:glycosyltransferase involved in cell wall biosynthesis
MKSDYPLVSIGLPVFNSEKTIVRALDSLLAQSYPNFEIIVSDNLSDDKTTEICKKYAQRDHRIKFYLNEKNLGINANFKIVCEKAMGKYFMWAAGDDFWEPEFVATLVKELESDPRIGVALCAVKRQYPDGRLLDTITFDEKYYPNNLSKLRVAAYLLSPKRQIVKLKYNLFICGLFRYEAVKGTLILDDILSYGERAFLSTIALKYRFCYIENVLFVKTVYKKSFKKRNPDDKYARNKKKIKYRERYSRIMGWVIKSPNISIVNKLFVFIILYYISYKYIEKKRKNFRGILPTGTKK